MAAAATAVLGALGHLANLGQFAEMGQNHALHQEQMNWARRGYSLDKQQLRLDLLNAVKEDIRDHYSTYASSIDTMLLVHTLLFTFALAMLQFSDNFILKTEDQCPECVEVREPWLAYLWVWLCALMLVIPFWCVLMTIWCKLQLDKWLEGSQRRLNMELRLTLRCRCAQAALSTLQSSVPETAAEVEAELDTSLDGLAAFVADYQQQFVALWSEECSFLVRASTRLLWVSATLAVAIAGLMFWIFLVNRSGHQQAAHSHFAVVVLLGLFVPTLYAGWYRLRRRPIAAPDRRDNFRGAREAVSSSGRPSSTASLSTELLRQGLLRPRPSNSTSTVETRSASPARQPGAFNVADCAPGRGTAASGPDPSEASTASPGAWTTRRSVTAPSMADVS